MKGHFCFILGALVSSVVILDLIDASPVPNIQLPNHRYLSAKQKCEKDGSCTVIDDVVIHHGNLSIESGLRDRSWPDGIVHYRINDNIRGVPSRLSVVEAAIEDLNAYTCVTLVEATNQRDRIEIGSNPNDPGCHSALGYLGGPQEVNLGQSKTGTCFRKGIAIHEIIHSLGWLHEQARDDRDDYVEINYENLPNNTGTLRQFKKASEISNDIMSYYGVPYNYDSVMHYGKTAFADPPGAITIQTLNNPDALGDGEKIGQRKGLSPGDQQMINTKYGSTTKCQTWNPPPVQFS